MSGLTAQTSSFGPVTYSGICFTPDNVMAPLATLYRNNLAGYRDKLPVVVGKLAPETMQAVRQLAAYPGDYSIFRDATMPHRAAADGPQTLSHMRASLSHFTAERAPQDLQALAALTARLVCGITQFDERWFGAPRQSNIRYEHGTISHDNGLHRLEKVGGWHRDQYDDPAAGAWREYLLRTAKSAKVVANRQGKAITGRYPEDAELAAHGCLPVQPLDGTVVLIAAGPEGTLHRAHRPAPQDPPYASLLLRVIQSP